MKSKYSGAVNHGHEKQVEGSFDSWRLLRVCELSPIALLLHTSVTNDEWKQKTIFLYIRVLVVCQDPAIVYHTIQLSDQLYHQKETDSYQAPLTFCLPYTNLDTHVPSSIFICKYRNLHYQCLYIYIYIYIYIKNPWFSIGKVKITFLENRTISN